MYPHLQMLVTRILLAIAWVASAVVALPQLFVWSSINVLPKWPGGWYQCMPVGAERITIPTLLFHKFTDTQRSERVIQVHRHGTVLHAHRLSAHSSADGLLGVVFHHRRGIYRHGDTIVAILESTSIWEYG
jgi:hypothetical protein